MGRAAAERFAARGRPGRRAGPGPGGARRDGRGARRPRAPPRRSAPDRPDRPRRRSIGRLRPGRPSGGASSTCSSTRPGPVDVGDRPVRRRSTTTSGSPPSTSARSAPCAASGPRCRCCGAAEWARIVNVSAHSTKRQSPTLVAYTAAKAALTSLSQEPVAVARAGGDPRQHGVARLVPSEGMRATCAASRRSATPTPTTSTTSCGSSTRTSATRPTSAAAGDPAEIGPVIAFVGSRANTLHDRRQHQRRRRLRLLGRLGTGRPSEY